MPTLKEMLTEGRIPKKEWNALVQQVRALANMEVGPGLGFRKGVKYLLTLTALPTHKFTLLKQGKLVETAENVAGRLYLVEPVTIINIVAYVLTPSDVGAITIDVNVADNAFSNGTTLFTTQGNRPTIAQDGYIDDDSIPDVRNIEAGKFLQIDLDGIGEGAEGLTVIIYGK